MDPAFRWTATIWYRTERGPNGVEHDIEELHELHDLVERGPDWRAIERIEIKLERYDRALTVEEAAKL